MQSTTNHTVDLVLALLLALGSTIGAQIGARLTRFMRGDQLLIILGVAGAPGNREDGGRHPDGAVESSVSGRARAPHPAQDPPRAAAPGRRMGGVTLFHRPVVSGPP